MAGDNSSDVTGTDARTVEFVRLLSLHERRVKGYVLSLVPNWHAAEEIFAETNARLWEQFAEYQSDKDFGAWACTIAHYLVLAHRKRTQREQARQSDQFIEAVANATKDLATQPSRFHFLSQCLQLLEAGNRDLVRQFYAGEESVEQLARRTGRSAAAIYKSVARIRHWLHKCIEERLGKESLS